MSSVSVIGRRGPRRFTGRVNRPTSLGNGSITETETETTREVIFSEGRLETMRAPDSGAFVRGQGRDRTADLPLFRPWTTRPMLSEAQYLLGIWADHTSLGAVWHVPVATIVATTGKVIAVGR
jgi:hypothetical protein